MRTVIVALVWVGMAAIVPTPAEAQCRLFAADGTCPAGPRIDVTFGSGLQRTPAAEETLVQPLRSAPMVRLESVPIDCKMVRLAPRTVDPGFARPPAAGTNYSMRVTVVPACPAQ